MAAGAFGGLARSTQAGVQALPRAGALDGAFIRDLFSVLGAGDAQVLTGFSDPISFPGTTILNAGAADLCTLALPIPGPQPAGDDGKQIEVFDVTGKLHIITTPANGINLTKHVLTWSGTVGSNITLQAWNGTWIVMGTPNGVVIS